MKTFVRIIEEIMFIYTAYLAYCKSFSCFIGVLLSTIFFTYIGMRMTGIPVNEWSTMMEDEEKKKTLSYVMWTLTPYKMATWIVMIWALM